MNKKKYRSYLKTPHWLKTKQRIYKQRGGVCERPGCNKRYSLEVNHLSYERLGCELDSDLELICHDHHHEYHFGKKKPTRKHVGLVIRLRKVYRLLMPKTNEEVELLHQDIKAIKYALHIAVGNAKVGQDLIEVWSKVDKIDSSMSKNSLDKILYVGVNEKRSR